MNLKPGTLLQGGRYRIERLLGQGGFGITYLAVQSGLNRMVAIKEFFMKEHCNRDAVTSHVSVPSVGSQELVERFRQKFIKEAQMISCYKHPNIVSIYDIFEENGTAYYVMEYHGGGSLSSVLMPQSREKAVGYIRQIASALSYLHKHNTMHLDVKPSNVLLDDDGNAVLIDFGVSKRYDESGGQTSSTPVGVSNGYAPIEQYSHSVRNFTPATDIYSLGATLYKLLTGVTPPESSLLVCNPDLLDLPSSLPPDIVPLIKDCLAPNISLRPQNIEDFLRRLDRGAVPVGKRPYVLKSVPAGPVPMKAGVPKSDHSVDKTVISQVKMPKKPLRPAQSTHSSRPESAPKKKSSRWIWIILLLLAVCAVVALLLGRSDRPQDKMEESSQLTGEHNGHAWVDLGLPSGVKWATCNIGASQAYDSGYYFSWGEVELKPRGMGYFTSSADSYQDDISGSDIYDAARLKWGGNWRIPTKAEFEELLEECSWTWTKQAGRDGYMVTSRNNGNSIFFPAAGLRDGKDMCDVNKAGNYWSSTPNYAKTKRAYSLELTDCGPSVSANYRKYGGLTIRPVLGDLTCIETALVEESVWYPELIADDIVSEAEVPITNQNEPPPPPQEDYVEVVEEEESPIEIIDSYNRPPPPPPPPQEDYVEVVEEEVVEEVAIPFQLIEEKPSFQGGDANQFSKWVNQRLVYPEIAKENGVQGRVTLQFTVEKDGSITNVKVLRGVDPSLDEEAVRVVSMSPKWKPGKQRDRAVPVTYTFPVIFQLE